MDSTGPVGRCLLMLLGSTGQLNVDASVTPVSLLKWQTLPRQDECQWFVYGVVSECLSSCVHVSEWCKA